MRKYAEYGAYILIIVLVFVAIFVGFKIYQNVSAKKVPALDNLSSSSKDSKSEIPGLSDEEFSFITRPSLANLSQDDMKRLREILEKAAVETTNVKIDSACQASPFVIKTKIGTAVTVENTDTQSHKLQFGQNSELTVEKTATLKTETLRPGITRYACDGKPSGYILGTQ